MLRLEIDSEALEELATACEWYEQYSTATGMRFQESIEEAFDMLRSFPHAWPPYEKGTRRLILRRFPFAIIYRVGREKLRILAVMHLHRRPGYWWQRVS